MNFNLGSIHIESWERGDEITLKPGQYKLKIDYPLTRPAIFPLKVGKKGLSKDGLIAFICEKYKEVYASEDDPGHIPGMYNRARSEGPYGIWGHDLGDLVLCDVNIKGQTITLGVDS